MPDRFFFFFLRNHSLKDKKELFRRGEWKRVFQAGGIFAKVLSQNSALYFKGANRKSMDWRSEINEDCGKKYKLES